jgi:hypothetical protein
MKKSRLIIYSLFIGLIIALFKLINFAVYYDYVFLSNHHMDIWIGKVSLILTTGKVDPKV